MTKLGVRCAVSLAVLAGACGSDGGGESSDASGNAPADSVADLTGPLEIVLEPTSSTATIGPDGGTVDVTSSAGTVFSLVVPEGVLLFDVEVTATPVASIGNLGFDAYGVVFGPAGLSFLGIAELTITPEDEVSVDRQLPLMFDDTGEQFGFAEPKLDTSDMVIMVQHFSGYAFGDATRPSQAAFLERQASEAATRISSHLGEMLGRERVSQELDGESVVDLGQEFATHGKEYEEQVIAPRLAAANSSCAAASLAISTVLGYERQRGLLDATREFSPAEIFDLYKQAYPVCEEQAITKCKAAKDPSVLLQFWLTMNRVAQIFGAPDFAEVDVEKATKICDPVYTASGGGDGLTVTGTVVDVSKTFTLQGTFPGATVTFAYFPDGESGGSFTYKGSGNGVQLSGEGTYTIAEGDDEGVLIITGQSSGCATPGGCRDRTQVITLTPA